MERDQVADIIAVEQLLARYAVSMTQDDAEGAAAVFTPDGCYRAFGEDFHPHDFPTLVRAAPNGLYLTGTPLLDLVADSGTGVQTLCFVDQATHEMRIGYYSDTYLRTPDGWRLHTRSMTFLRRGGARDSGRAHDVGRPAPTADPAAR